VGIEVFLTLARWLGYLGVMGLVGAATFQSIVQFRLTSPHPIASARLLSRARAAALFSAGLLLASALLRLYGQLRLFVDPGEPLTGETFRLVTLESEWGRAWLIQAVIALVVLLLPLAIRSTWLLVPLATAVVTVGPLTGHAVENPWGQQVGLFLHGIHQLGGGVWIGTLFLVIIAGYGGTRGIEPEERHRVIARLVHSYSPVALVGVGTAIAAGLVLAFGYLSSIADLWSTGYGRALLIKTSFLVCTAGIGAYNWRRVRPGLGESTASDRLFRSATLELILGSLLLGATAVLVNLAAPAME
jgi:putative copper export protein